MKYYKLTDQDNYTRRGANNETLWGEGVTHTVDKEGGYLCTSYYIHFYFSPELAVLLNPIHADIQNPKLWEIEATCDNREFLLKGGSKKVTTIKEIPLPQFTTEQRVKFAILCALKVYKEESFVNWANNWLDGSDRSYAYVANAASYFTNADGFWAAYYAARAADDAAAAAANAAYYAARAAAGAARANVSSDENFIIEIAKSIS